MKIATITNPLKLVKLLNELRISVDELSLKQMMILEEWSDDFEKQETAAVSQKPYLKIPQSGKWPGIIHFHVMGVKEKGKISISNRAHLDFRYKPGVVNHLLGCSLQPPAVMRHIGAGNTGLLKNKAGDKFRAQPKMIHSKGWLKVEGWKAPGEEGSTKNTWSKFFIASKLSIEFGAQRPVSATHAGIHEYYLTGKAKSIKIPTIGDGILTLSSSKFSDTRFLMVQLGKNKVFAMLPKNQAPYRVSGAKEAREWCIAHPQQTGYGGKKHIPKQKKVK